MNVIHGFGVLCLLAGIATIVLLTSSDLQSGIASSDLLTRSDPANWSEWTSWQCSMSDTGCFYYHFRNCSTGNISHCGKEKETWGIKSCTSCTDELTTVPTPTGTDTTVSSTFAWWSDWGNWNCTKQTLDKTCEMYRERRCKTNSTVDCLTAFGGSAEEKRLCDGVICPAQWEAWESWKCQETSKVCWMLRSRECSTGNKLNCGNDNNHTDVDICDNIICPAHWTTWAEWHCTQLGTVCLMVRFRNCSTGDVSNCGNESERHEQRHFGCDSCQDELTTVPIPTGTDTTVSSTFAWWSDWGNWNCTEQKLDKTCEMYRERQCKTNNTDDCLRGSPTEKRPCDGVICPAQWGAWGRWQCKETNKVCWMLRSRECSTGNKLICGNSTNNTDATNCNNTICPAHWTAWAEWQCAQLGTICLMARFRNCSTGDVNNCGQESERREQTHFDCDICPDNGFTGFAHWENWSTWKCKLGLHGTCSMSRYRNCSTAAEGDCKGDHLETLNCTQQECPENETTSITTETPSIVLSSTSKLPCTIDPTKCTNPNIFGVCNFDSSTLCSWTQSNQDSFDWSLQSGPTLTDGTGPNNDHTLQTAQGKYLFVETSAPRVAGELASIVSPELPSDHTVCLEFWYYMFGNGIGSLLVHAEDIHSKNAIQLFKKDGDQGESWFKASVTIFSKQVPNNYRLVITGNVGSSYLGDTAIDDLALHDGACEASWSEWTYNTCSKTCGGGHVQKLRSCSTGDLIDCLGSPSEIVTCNVEVCPGS